MNNNKEQKNKRVMLDIYKDVKCKKKKEKEIIFLKYFYINKKF